MGDLLNFEKRGGCSSGGRIFTEFAALPMPKAPPKNHNNWDSIIFVIVIYIYIIQILSVCVCVCLSSIGGQTAGPIMTKFGTHMRIDLGMVPT